MRNHVDILIEAVEALRSHYCEEIEYDPLNHDAIRDYNDKHAMGGLKWSLNKVQKHNIRGDSICGSAAAITRDWLNDYFSAQDINGRVVTATSAAEDTTFHHYNIVQIDDGEPIIVDLTASQFFFKFMDVFDRPYFVGTRNELKTVVQSLQLEALEAARRFYPDKDLPSTWHLDFETQRDHSARVDFDNALEADDRPHVHLESYHYGWEITYGDVSRAIAYGTPKDEFARVVNAMDQVIEERLPQIPDLISHRNKDRVTLADSPQF